MSQLIRAGSVLGCILLLVWARTGPASAHAVLIESSPKGADVAGRSLSMIILRFNGRIEKALSRVTLTGPSDVPVPLPRAATDAEPDRLVVPVRPLRPGAYLIRWKVLSTDGHVTQGAFRFTIGEVP